MMSKLNWNRVGFFVLGSFLGPVVLSFFGGIFGGALGGAKRG
jgi:hypothetical protein